MKIIGNTVGMGLPKPSMMQTDPSKGDFVKDKEEYMNQILANVKPADAGTGIIAAEEHDESVTLDFSKVNFAENYTTE